MEGGHEVNMPAHDPSMFLTLTIALLFAAIFLFGGRVAHRPGRMGRRRFLSFASGISVAYIFVHVLPALHHMRDMETLTPTGLERLFPEYSVYLWAMAGFLVFYGIETMVARPAGGAEPRAGEDAATWQPWVQIGGFALYAWLLSFLLVWAEKSTLALCLYAVAMGMHIFPTACDLSSRYKAGYDRRGAFLLAFTSLAGWASGLLLDIPTPLLVNMVALVAGGVIINTAIAELAKEKEGRFWSFLTGASVYAALLLILSHFEKGGEL